MHSGNNQHSTTRLSFDNHMDHIELGCIHVYDNSMTMHFLHRVPMHSCKQHKLIVAVLTSGSVKSEIRVPRSLKEITDNVTHCFRIQHGLCVICKISDSRITNVWVNDTKPLGRGSFSPKTNDHEARGGRSELETIKVNQRKQTERDDVWPTVNRNWLPSWMFFGIYFVCWQGLSNGHHRLWWQARYLFGLQHLCCHRLLRYRFRYQLRMLFGQAHQDRRRSYIIRWLAETLGVLVFCSHCNQADNKCN